MGIYPKKTIIQKDICTRMSTAALFIIAKTQKQPKHPSTDEWVKMWYVRIHTYNIYTPLCVYVCIYVCVYVCIYVCVYVCI